MKKSELVKAVDAGMKKDKSALQTIWDNVNKGQKKQIRKIEECQAILERYGITD